MNDYVKIPAPKPAPMIEIPTFELHPYQVQRVKALEAAEKALPDRTTEEIIKAASFIETGKVLD